MERPLDFEQRRVHELVVQARDGGAHPELGSAFVTVHVRDANDNQPSMTVIFLSADGSPRVSEAAPPGQLVARISVSDPDDGDFAHVNVSLEGGEGHFALSTQDSVIYLVCVARQLDREERDAYNLRVTATDSGSPPLRAEATFVLHVTDVNDNAPAFDRQLYRPEPLPEVALPGSFVVRVMAQDRSRKAHESNMKKFEFYSEGCGENIFKEKSDMICIWENSFGYNVQSKLETKVTLNLWCISEIT